MRTDDPEYTDRLRDLSGARWKEVLDVQRPYRWKLRRYKLGRTLDIGCGIGRNLATLPAGSVGIDHNATSVAEARRRGLEAYTPEEFWAKDWKRPFDGMLVAHVIEHVSPEVGLALLEEYRPMLKIGARVLLICPQEKGFAYDPTHISWTTDEALVGMAREVGLTPVSSTSFPFPRWAGRRFTHNAFYVLAVNGQMIAPESRWGVAGSFR